MYQFPFAPRRLDLFDDEVTNVNTSLCHTTWGTQEQREQTRRVGQCWVRTDQWISVTIWRNPGGTLSSKKGAAWARTPLHQSFSVHSRFMMGSAEHSFEKEVLS